MDSLFMKGIIVTSQRSGSGFLRYCLQSHEEITCDGELLIGGSLPLPQFLRNRRLAAKLYRYVRARAWNPKIILDEFLALKGAPVHIFKAMYNQLENKYLKDYIGQRSDIRIIHLRRDNLLKQYVSKQLIAKKRDGLWQPHTTSNLKTVTTKISPKAAIKEMQRVKQKFEEFEQLFEKHQKIELVYENMIDGQCLSNEATQKICDLFQTKYQPMCCEFLKVNPNKLELLVKNYQEISDSFRNSEYEEYLDN